MRKFLAVLFIIASTGFAQAQQSDPEFMSKAITALQQQRNNIADALAASDAKLAMANDQLAKANAKIKELQDKAAAEKPKDPQ